MGTQRVVLDTNIYFSGLGWSGYPDECVELVLGGEVRGYSSPDMLSELQRVLQYPRLPVEPAEAKAFYEAVEDGVEIVKPSEEHDAAVNDPDDDMVIDCAIEANADYIVTGNTDHFPDTYLGTVVVEPGEYIRSLSK